MPCWETCQLLPHTLSTMLVPAWKCFCPSYPWNQLSCGDGGCGMQIFPLLFPGDGGFSALQVLPLISHRDEGCGLLHILPLLSCGDRVVMPSGSCSPHPPSALPWGWRLCALQILPLHQMTSNNCKPKPSVSIYHSYSFH